MPVSIPVIDIANLIQTITQVLNDVTKIANQVEQIEALQSQLASINGMRNLGNVAPPHAEPENPGQPRPVRRAKLDESVLWP